MLPLRLAYRPNDCIKLFIILESAEFQANRSPAGYLRSPTISERPYSEYGYVFSNILTGHHPAVPTYSYRRITSNGSPLEIQGTPVIANLLHPVSARPYITVRLLVKATWTTVRRVKVN